MANPLTVIPWPVVQYFDNNGAPLNGGLLYSYASGTSTPQATYSDANGTANSNPVVLDSAGRAKIFLSSTSYKFVLTDANGVQLWSIDGVPSTGLSQSIVGIGATVTFLGGLESVPITNTSYGSGTTHDVCLANTGVFTIDSAQLVGTFALQAMILSVSAVTTTVALVNLSDGSPDTPISTVAGTSTTGTQVTGTAIPFATAGLAKTYAVKAKVSGGTGFGWNVQIVRIA